MIDTVFFHIFSFSTDSGLFSTVTGTRVMFWKPVSKPNNLKCSIFEVVTTFVDLSVLNRRDLQILERRYQSVNIEMAIEMM